MGVREILFIYFILGWGFVLEPTCLVDVLCQSNHTFGIQHDLLEI